MARGALHILVVVDPVAGAHRREHTCVAGVADGAVFAVALRHTHQARQRRHALVEVHEPVPLALPVRRETFAEPVRHARVGPRPPAHRQSGLPRGVPGVREAVLEGVGGAVVGEFAVPQQAVDGGEEDKVVERERALHRGFVQPRRAVHLGRQHLLEAGPVELLDRTVVDDACEVEDPPALARRQLLLDRRKEPRHVLTLGDVRAPLRPRRPRVQRRPRLR